MKAYSRPLIIVAALLIFTLFIQTCEKHEFFEQAAVTSGEAKDITPWEAKISGAVIDVGQGITEYGHCWSTGKEPTVESNKTSFGSITNKNSFNSDLTGLEPGQTYYVRAYVISGNQTLYSEEQTFTSRDGVATLQTSAISAITINTAISGGNITDNGGAAITTRGVCWNTTGDPSIADSKTEDGTGTGVYTSSITGLTINTTYYVRAFATNSFGTVYGITIEFTTGDGIPVLTTATVTDITINSATSGGEITSDGGDAITARGVCWNTTGDPSIADNKTNDGPGSSDFSSTLGELTHSTTYYVRAYVINSFGTHYGTTKQFVTLLGDIDGNSYTAVVIGTQKWMAENLKTTKYNDGAAITLVTDNTAWSNLTTEAYCWYNNDQATYKPDYGALYNWYAVNTGKLCPTGWHVPSDAEWKTLEIYLGMVQAEADATGWRGSPVGGKLKETGTVYWNSPNTGATNESGFSGLPGGYRSSGSGNFYLIGSYGYWWSSAESSASSAWRRLLSYSDDDVGRGTNSKGSGFSVRCLRD